METNFKVGDLVLVSPWNQKDYITKIAHVTPKGYVQLEGYVGKYHAKYNNQGHQIPYSMTGGHIRPATDKDIKRIAHRRRVAALKQIDWDKEFTPEQIEQLLTGIKKVQINNKQLREAEEQKKIEAPKE